MYSGRKITCRTGDSNPRQYCAWLFSRTLDQLSCPCLSRKKKKKKEKKTRKKKKKRKKKVPGRLWQTEAFWNGFVSTTFVFTVKPSHTS